MIKKRKKNEPIKLTDVMLECDFAVNKPQIKIFDKTNQKMFLLRGDIVQKIIDKLTVDQELFDEICEEYEH